MKHRLKRILIISILLITAPPTFAQEAAVQTYKPGELLHLAPDEGSFSWWLNTNDIDPKNESLSLFTDTPAQKKPQPVGIWQEIKSPLELDVPKGTKNIWLRKIIYFDSLPPENISVYLGPILDRDQTYFNGQKIGQTGDWSAFQIQAFDRPRLYSIPGRWIEPGQNNILLIRIRSELQTEIGLGQKNLSVGPTDLLIQNIANKYGYLPFIVLITLFPIPLLLFWMFGGRRKRIFIGLAACILLSTALLLLHTPVKFILGDDFELIFRTQLLLTQWWVLIYFYYWISLSPLRYKIRSINWILYGLLGYAIFSSLGLLSLDDYPDIILLSKTSLFIIGVTCILIGFTYWFSNLERRKLQTIWSIVSFVSATYLFSLFFPVSSWSMFDENTAVLPMILFALVHTVYPIWYTRRLNDNAQMDVRRLSLSQMAAECTEDFNLNLKPLIRYAEKEGDVSLIKTQLALLAGTSDDLMALVDDNMQLDFKRIKFQDFLKDIIDYFKRSYSDEIQFDVRHYWNGFIYLDQARMRHVVSNLLHLAAQNGTGEKISRVQIQSSAVQQERSLLLTITNDGTGLPNFHNAELFADMYAGEKHTLLGLVVSKKIVEYHGGTISFSSTPGKGISYVLKIPI